MNDQPVLSAKKNDVREELQRINGERTRFTARFVRYGRKGSFRGGTKPTVLLADITDINGNVVTDHLWFNLTKGFDALKLNGNDQVEFEARVKLYIKGYRGRRDVPDKPVKDDYKLSHPTKVKKLNARRRW